MKELNINNYQSELFNMIENKQEEFVFGIPTKTLVFKGKNDINDHYCENNNIEVYNSFNMGGCIVSFDGDIDIAIFKYDGWEDGSKFINSLLKYLKTKIEDIKLDGNDLIVNDLYKVASISSVNLGDKFIYTGAHISINTDLDVIKNICTKEMIKIPKGLSEYGITTQDIKEFILQYE